MSKIVFGILIALLLIQSLALTGFLAYGFATGHFDGEMRDQYMATWRGEKLVPPPVEEEVKVDAETPQEAGARIAQAEIEREALSRDMQRHVELLRNMQFSVKAAQQQVEKNLRQLNEDRTTFDTQVAAYQQRALDEGFQKALKEYSLLKPKQAKTDFMKMAEDEAVRYLAAMKPDVAKKILEQFRTPEEEQRRLTLLRMLNEQGVIALGK